MTVHFNLEITQIWEGHSFHEHGMNIVICHYFLHIYYYFSKSFLTRCKSFKAGVCTNDKGDSLQRVSLVLVVKTVKMYASDKTLDMQMFFFSQQLI